MKRRAGSVKRQEWLAAFEAAVVKINVTHSGRIDWDTAIYMYNQQQYSPEAAAVLYTERRPNGP